MKVKQVSLVICLFLFLFVVVGGGLHLNPGGAFLAAATGTPLVIHIFNRWTGGSLAQNPRTPAGSSASLRRFAEADENQAHAFEGEDIVRQ